jgi:predicted peptidase
MSITNTKIKVTTSGFQLNCAIWTPPNYDNNKKYPLIIFGHGTGEAGTDINKLYAQGLPNVLKNGFVPPFDCIIVCPQASSYGVNPAWLQPMLADIKSRYSIDEANMFLTGLSAGGWMCYGSIFNVAADFGKNFKGIVVLSGATQDINKANYDWIKTSVVPVLAIVGGSDTSYVEYNNNVITEINRRVSGDAVLYTRSGIGHGGWTDIYNGSYKLPDGSTIWDWMMKRIMAATIIPAPQPDPITVITVLKEVTIQYMSDGSFRIK